MALSDDDIARIMVSIPEPASDSGNDVAVWATNLCLAIEAETRKQDDALIRQMLEALECSGEPDDPGHRCSHCDDYVDRNSVLRNAARKRLESKP